MTHVLKGLLLAAALSCGSAFAVQSVPSAGNGTIVMKTVSSPSVGMQVTETSASLDYATFAAQHQWPAVAASTGAQTSGASGPPPSTPPPPGAGDVRPDISQVQYQIDQNGWTRNTTYNRDVQQTPNGIQDGPWGLTSDLLQQSSGGGHGACTGKDPNCTHQPN